MPAEICKIIICGIEQAESVVSDATLILNDSDTTLPKEHTQLVEAVRDSAAASVAAFEFLSKYGLPSGVPLDSIEAYFTQARYCWRSILVDVLDSQTD